MFLVVLIKGVCALFVVSAARMPGCAIATCNNYNRRTKGTNIIYHRFPKENKIRKQWITKCKRADKFIVENARVCSVHFTPEDYQRDLKHELLGGQPKNHLNPTAIPSVNLPYSKNRTTTHEQVYQKPYYMHTPNRPTVTSPKQKSGQSLIPAGELLIARNVELATSAEETPNIQDTATCVGAGTRVSPSTVEGLPRLVDVQIVAPPKELPNIQDTATCIIPITFDHDYIQPSSPAKNSATSRMMRLHAREVRKRALNRLRSLSPPNIRPKTAEVGTNTPEDVELESVRRKIEALTSRVERLKKLNAALKLKYHKQEMLKKQVAVLERKCKSYEKQMRESGANVEAIQLKLTDTFTASQVTCLMSGRTKAKWGKEDMCKALTLWEMSKESYSYVRKHMGLPLPGGATLRRWRKFDIDYITSC